MVQNGAVGGDFLDLTDAVLCCGERGLFSLAFPPDTVTSGRLFVNFTRKPDGHTVVARFRRSGDPLVADPTSRVDLVWPDGNPFIEQPFPNHNGGHMTFGPDGFLCIGLGDGGAGNDPGLARTAVVNVPAGLAAGAYLLSAVADVDGAIPELAGNDGAAVNGRVATRAVNVLSPAP